MRVIINGFNKFSFNSLSYLLENYWCIMVVNKYSYRMCEKIKQYLFFSVQRFFWQTVRSVGRFISFVLFFFFVLFSESVVSMIKQKWEIFTPTPIYNATRQYHTWLPKNTKKKTKGQQQATILKGTRRRRTGKFKQKKNEQKTQNSTTTMYERKPLKKKQGS